MAAPVGNKNSLGKHHGRKSAYEERQDAEAALALWEDGEDVSVLAEKIKKKGKISGKEVFAFCALSAPVTKNYAAILKLADKMLPDMIDIKSDGKPLRVIEVICGIPDSLRNETDIDTNSPAPETV